MTTKKKVSAKKKAPAKKRASSKTKTAKTRGRQSVNEHGLTDNYQMFADLYLADPKRDASEAYRKTFKTCKTDNAARVGGCNLLKKPEICAYIDVRLAEIIEDIQYDQTQWLKDQLKILARCLGDVEYPEQITIDGKAIQAMTKKFDASGANRSQELLGRYLKILTDKVQHEAGTTLLDLYEAISDKNLGLPSGD